MKRSIMAVPTLAILLVAASANAQTFVSTAKPAATSQATNDKYSDMVQKAIADHRDPYRFPGSDPVGLNRELCRAFANLCAKGEHNMILTGREVGQLWGHRENAKWIGEHDNATEKGLMPISNRLWMRVAQKYELPENSPMRDQIAEDFARGRYDPVDLRESDSTMISGAEGIGVISPPFRTIGFVAHGVKLRTPIRTKEGTWENPVFITYFTWDDGRVEPPCVNITGMFGDVANVAAVAPFTEERLKEGVDKAVRSNNGPVNIETRRLTDNRGRCSGKKGAFLCYVLPTAAAAGLIWASRSNVDVDVTNTIYNGVTPPTSGSATPPKSSPEVLPTRP